MPALIQRVLGLLFLCLAALPSAAQDVVFERQTLNAGLPPAPETLDRSTPQSTLESFFHAAEREDWQTAAYLLDLAEIDPARQPEVAASIARQLFSVIERRVVVRWSELPERPDGMFETGSGDDPLFGEKRRSLSLGAIELDERPVTIRLNRIKPSDGEAVWVFAPQTVANVPALYEQHGPSRLEQRIPERFRTEAFWNLRWWEVIFLPLALVLIAIAGSACWRFFGRLARGAHRSLLRRILREARLPMTIAVVAMLLSWLTTDLLVVSSAAAAVLEPAILLGYVVAGVALAVNVMDALLARVVDTDPTDMADPDNAGQRALATGLAGARRGLIVIAILAGAGIVLASASVFRSLGLSLLASASVLTIVLGFAAREVLGNIMASLQIALNRSARIGDFLEFEGQWCTVERIHFTYVQLRLWTGNRLVVPVSYFISKPFENWSQVEFKMTRLVELKLAHTAEVQPLRERLQAFADKDDRISPKDEAFCYVTSQDMFGKSVLFAIPVPVPDAGWAVECALREYLLDEAERLGIELPAEPARPDAA